MKFCRVREQENNYRKHVIMILMFNPRSVLSENRCRIQIDNFSFEF